MKPWILLWALLSMAGSAAAQALRDPTLPPASVLAPASGEAGADNGELRLDAIRRQPGKRPQAMINGQLLKVGEEIGGRRLIRIGESEVVLQSGEGPAQQKETVRLAPAVDKIMKTNRSGRPATRGEARGGA